MEPLRTITSQDKMVWMTQPREDVSVMQRTSDAFDIAQGKFEETGNTEIVMQTAEAFGRGVFADQVKKKPKQWTMKEWMQVVTRDVLNPLGIGATITELTEDTARSVVFRLPLHEDAEDPHFASLFTYGFLRGLLCSVFPEGEVIMKSTMATGAPMTSLVFKTSSSQAVSPERERVKEIFTTMKKDA